MRFLSEHLVAYPEYANPTGEFPMKFNAPMTPLFHAWDAIVKSKEDHPDPITREHVKILHDVLVKDFDEPLEKAEECRLTGRITYQYLWTVFKPGNLLYRQYPIGKDRTMKLTAAKYGVDADNAECYILDGEWVCWDGNRFGLASASNTFYPLDGVMNIAELHTMPFDLHPDREAIKARLLKRGQAYAQLTRTELKVYTGPEGESPADDIVILQLTPFSWLD